MYIDFFCFVVYIEFIYILLIKRELLHVCYYCTVSKIKIYTHESEKPVYTKMSARFFYMSASWAVEFCRNSSKMVNFAGKEISFLTKNMLLKI